MEPGPEGDRFLRLATGLAGATHPALARVVEAGISRDGLRAVRWLAMEIAEGRNAALRIVEGAQPPVTVLRRMRVLGGALHLLHERGVVHGDVVPENVLLRADGGATLLDFERSFLARMARPRPCPSPRSPPREPEDRPRRGRRPRRLRRLRARAAG